MPENRDDDALKSEIGRRHFVRAALIAEQIGLPEEEMRNLRYRALGQMSVIYRSAHGTRHLARQYGFSKEDVKKALEAFADEMRKEGNTKPLEPCYDYRTGKYLSFEEWMEQYLKIWDKFSV
jgi:hypothetical protein